MVNKWHKCFVFSVDQKVLTLSEEITSLIMVLIYVSIFKNGACVGSGYILYITVTRYLFYTLGTAIHFILVLYVFNALIFIKNQWPFTVFPIRRLL